MSDSHLFKIARECSLKSDYTSNCSSARVGCVVTYKGTILAKSIMFGAIMQRMIRNICQRKFIVNLLVCKK